MKPNEGIAIMRLHQLAIAGLLGGLALSCSQPLERRLEQHPARVLPQGASQLFDARVERLSRNPLAVLAYARAAQLEFGAALKGTSQTLALLGGLSRVVLGTYPSGARSEASAVVVATGRFDEPGFRKTLEARGVPYVTSRYEDRTYYTCGRGDTRCHVCFCSAQLVVVSPEENLLKRTLDLVRHPSKSVANDKLFAPLLKSFSPELDLWATGAFPRGLTLSLGPQMQQMLEMIHSFTVKLSCGEKTQLGLILHCATAEAAQADGMLLQKVLGGLAQEIYDAGYNVRDLLDALNRSNISINTDERTADFELVLTQDETAKTVAVLKAPPTPQAPSAADLLRGLLPPATGPNPER